MSRAFSLFLALVVPLSSFASGHDVSTSTANQSAPVVTGNADGFAVAWLNQSGPFRTVTAARVSSAGDPLDGAGIPLDEKATFSTAIAHSPSESLVVWGTSSSIVAARVTSSGVRLDTTPLLLSSQSNGQVAAVWDGSRYFVVWSTGNRLVGSFVGSDGTVTNPKVFLDETALGNAFYTPDVSWDGRQFMVVFVEDGPYTGVFCSVSCAPPPDQVRVMRVSAAGDAIDTSRIEIPGVHYSAHIASTGTESLIALDGDFETSTMFVRDDGLALRLGPEVSLFRWFYHVSSDVAWDGAAYVVGWRYQKAYDGAGWLAASRISRTGMALGSFVTAGEPAVNSIGLGPSVAANDGGQTALAVLEKETSSSITRTRLYLLREFSTMPPPPPAPRNAISYFSGSKALIEWQSDGGADGFVLEQSTNFGASWYRVSEWSPETRTASTFASVGNLVRVRAYGPGGFSEGTITSIGSQQRRRSQRP